MNPCLQLTSILICIFLSALLDLKYPSAGKHIWASVLVRALQRVRASERAAPSPHRAHLVCSAPCSSLLLFALTLSGPPRPTSILPDRPSRRDLDGVSKRDTPSKSAEQSKSASSTAEESKSASSYFRLHAKKTSRTPQRCSVGFSSSASPSESRRVPQGCRQGRAEARGRSPSAKGNKYGQSSRPRKVAKISRNREDVKELRQGPKGKMSRLAVRQETPTTPPSQPETCAEGAYTAPDGYKHRVRDNAGKVAAHAQPAAETPEAKDGVPTLKLPLLHVTRKTRTTLVDNATPSWGFARLS